MSDKPNYFKIKINFESSLLMKAKIHELILTVAHRYTTNIKCVFGAQLLAAKAACIIPQMIEGGQS